MTHPSNDSRAAKIIRFTTADSVGHALTRRASSGSVSATDSNRSQPFSGVSVATICATKPGKPAFSRHVRRSTEPKAQTRWTFLLIGNELDAFADARCRVQGRDYGHIHASDDGAVNVYVRKWSTIIAQAKWRHQFFRDRLELQVGTEDGLKYLQSKYAKYLPKSETPSIELDKDVIPLQP